MQPRSSLHPITRSSVHVRGYSTILLQLLQMPPFVCSALASLRLVVIPLHELISTFSPSSHHSLSQCADWVQVRNPFCECVNQAVSIKHIRCRPSLRALTLYLQSNTRLLASIEVSTLVSAPHRFLLLLKSIIHHVGTVLASICKSLLRHRK